VERVREAVAEVPGMAVCGAAYDGLGVPACVATAERAAREVLRQWAGDGPVDSAPAEGS
jgi:oxygen-dependent protoporphyrinogen oxidase